MKHLPIQSESLYYLIHSFREWLDIQGYSPGTVKELPGHLQEFLHHVETVHKVTQPRQIKAPCFNTYFEHISTRTNKRDGGALSLAYLNKHYQALDRFAEYLRKSGRHDLAPPNIRRTHPEQKVIDVVTIEEIKALFAACDQHPATPLFEAIAWRDKAQLIALYSCGLRRSECEFLDLQDINFDRGVIHVRKGKKQKERFVPVGKQGLDILQTYIYDYRPRFLRANELNALFVSLKGLRMGNLNMGIRLRILIQRTELEPLKEKDVSLHTLRHSIATHLLHAGMSLENISRFLGHSSLESTQIYTHLLESANL